MGECFFWYRLSRTCCVSSQQVNSVMPCADAEMHPDRESPWRLGARGVVLKRSGGRLKQDLDERFTVT